MASPLIWYVNGLKTCLRAGLGVASVSGTVKAMILHDTYVLDQDNHDFVNDVSASQASGTGYTTGGITLGSVTVTLDGPTNTVAFTAAPVTGLNLLGCYVVIFVDTGTPSTSPLLAIGDASDGSAVDVTLTSLNWASNGIAAITAA